MPRSVYIVCAWLFALISVALAARYGIKSADIGADGVIYGTMFGAIAAGGGIMQALAVHVATVAGMARGYRILWAVVIGTVGLAAMFATVLSSLGAIAGRADAVSAQRSKASDSAKDDRATMKRLTDEREGLKFVPADADAVAQRRQPLEAQSAAELPSVATAIRSSAARIVAHARPRSKRSKTP